LQEYFIGTGGWAFFHVPGIQSLPAYSRAFDFVEVNSTFYRFPSLKQVERWRRLVPEDFTFSVRANRAITHKNRLQPTQETIEAFEKMRSICSILRADILHMQIPATVELTSHALKRFLNSVTLGGLRIALEIRASRQSKIPEDLAATMKDNDIIHSVDLSRGETPAYKSDTLYTRLFGRGEQNVYEPTDEELTEIDSKAKESCSQKVKMSFHFVKMYKDAARLKIYKHTGKFPSVTRSKGYLSLEEVLKEDAPFPISKERLIEKQGWKLFDETENKRTRVKEVLEKLPEANYSTLESVVCALQVQHALDQITVDLTADSRTRNQNAKFRRPRQRGNQICI
jgi:uncharacterized protein YecE (DUF72 family)